MPNTRSAAIATASNKPGPAVSSPPVQKCAEMMFGIGCGIQRNRCRTTVAELSRLRDTRAELLFTGDQVVCLSRNQAARSGPIHYRRTNDCSRREAPAADNRLAARRADQIASLKPFATRNATFFDALLALI